MIELKDLLAPNAFDPLIYWILALFAFPLLSFFTTGLLKDKASVWSSLLLGINTCISGYIAVTYWGEMGTSLKGTWFEIGGTVFNYSFLLDNAALIMLVIVNFISLLVHIFSAEYMRHDKAKPRYYAFLGLFTFSMLGIVLFHNLLFIFIFWELVGLSSYLLIGFWFEKKSASLAANKAFIMNRIGDLGFLTGLMILYTQFETLDLGAIEFMMGESQIEDGNWVVTYFSNGKEVIHVLDGRWLSAAGIALFCGAVGKSAQFPLQIWLPDAMEGPTPVSALIHAATMVAAGVFMLSRVFVLLDAQALEVIAIVGAITALMAAVAALSQFDIKKVLAYSTVSQLGYMVLAMGVGAYDAGLFHLFTHAFFKAGLFLSAGIIIHQLHGLESEGVKFNTQDMRVMGGLKQHLPITFACFVICSLSLAGLPGFSGFLSKEAILINTHAWSVEKGGGYYLIELMAFATVILTAFYIMRAVMLVFTGKFRLPELTGVSDIAGKLKEGNRTLLIPVVILALLSLSFAFGSTFDAETSWLHKAVETPSGAMVPTKYAAVGQAEMLESAGADHIWLAVVSIGLALAGIIAALLIYKPGAKLAEAFDSKREPVSPLVQVSFYHWYQDVLYTKVILKFILTQSKMLAWFDEKILDGCVNLLARTQVVVAHLTGMFDRYIIDGFVHLTAFTSGKVGQLTRSIQTGNVQTYILSAIAMLIMLLLWFAF
ncbi:MAG: NADH-quinone oxidoreductase subunit L [Roseivirga sp.]|nr:NADH-quinone oxidoreductase subunit L [Roseivirga sp.]